jgi:hypothetical protein
MSDEHSYSKEKVWIKTKDKRQKTKVTRQKLKPRMKRLIIGIIDHGY